MRTTACRRLSTWLRESRRPNEDAETKNLEPRTSLQLVFARWSPVDRDYRTIMNWMQQWRALAARIEGLMQAGQYLVSTFAVVSVDQYAVGRNWILPHFRSIRDDLVQFRDRFSAELPESAVHALNHFINHVVVPEGVVITLRTYRYLGSYRPSGRSLTI